MSETFSSLSALEQELTFSSFSRADALRLGLLINEASQGYPAPVATEIVINGVVVYRYFQDGARPDSELWLERKRNALRTQLHNAVEEERYEDAAKLRDELKSLSA